MGMKCPEYGFTAHTRTSEYQAGTLKKNWYQCRNMDCSCTFTAMDCLDTIIMKPLKMAQKPEPVQAVPHRLPQTLNRYGSASKLSNRQKITV